MLVTFKTNSYADITMFGDAAESLLKLMGLSGNVPGALVATDVAGALAKLQSNLAAATEEPAAEAAADANNDDEDNSNKVALATRALPLIELLESAVESGHNVMWDH